MARESEERIWVKDVDKVAEYLDHVVSDAPKDIVRPLKDMLDDLDESLPPATSGEVLSARARW